MLRCKNVLLRVPKIPSVAFIIIDCTQSCILCFLFLLQLRNKQNNFQHF